MNRYPEIAAADVEMVRAAMQCVVWGVPRVSRRADTDFGYYVTELASVADRYLPRLATSWDRERIKAAARLQFKAEGFDVATADSVIERESSYRPVGVYGGSAQTALAADSSAYGIGQVTSRTYAHTPMRGYIPHSYLIHPILGGRAAAQALAYHVRLASGNVAAGLKAYRGT